MFKNNFAMYCLTCILLIANATHAQWTQVLNDTLNACITSNEPQIFVGTMGNGIYKSIDSGLTWVQCNQGLRSLRVSSIIVANSKLFAGTVAGIFVSEDNGAHWISRNQGLSDTAIKSLCFNGTTIVAGTYNGSSKSIYLSHNEGESWQCAESCTIVFNPSLIVNFKGILFSDSYGFGLCRSTNDGKTWDILNYPLGYIRGGYAFASKIFVGGDSWSSSSKIKGPPSAYFSDDSGKTWFATPLINGGQVGAFASSEAKIFAGTSEGFFVSSDTGKSWIAKNEGLNSRVYRLAIQGGYIFAAAKGGIVRRPLSEISIGIESSTLHKQWKFSPLVISVKQNSNALSLSYVSVNYDHISISLYDMSGKRITNMIEKDLCPGNYEFFKHNLVTYHPGIYALRYNCRAQKGTFLIRIIPN